MLTVPQELSFLCVARKSDLGHFIDLFSHPMLLRMSGEAPYYLVRVVLNPEGSYWGWWEPEVGGDGKSIHHIHPARILLEVCFPYGSKIEEDRDMGRVVRVDVHEVRRLTPEEERIEINNQIQELMERRSLW